MHNNLAAKVCTPFNNWECGSGPNQPLTFRLLSIEKCKYANHMHLNLPQTQGKHCREMY